MDTVIENSKSWHDLRLFTQTNTVITDSCVLNMIEINHIPCDKEKTLHEYRNRINDYENTLVYGRNWEYYKKIVNPYELVYTQKKYNDFPESVCLLKPLSRSYFKMIEILEVIKFFEANERDNIHTAHVCEGPGGFIEAIFDRASHYKKKIQTSVAMTLRSKQTNVPGWRRASQFLHNNKNIKIIYGFDGTGNIMKPENQQYFIDYCTDSESKVDIFTADGGFDFSFDYGKQEELIFPLLVTSTKIGFEVLNKGGIFVLKLFDFYHKYTTDLLYLLSCHFQEWTLYKPATSRPCNPEQYFVGKGFIGCSDYILDSMRLWCSMIENNQKLHSLFNNEYSDDFKKHIDELRENSFNTQIEYLEKVFYIIDKNNNDLIQKYLKRNEIKSYEWCLTFKVPISVYRYHSVLESHTYQQVVSQ
jgi:23S rRNA U2552 (ribose-2'-O)-methylase RlmE/FtsJ